MTSSRTDEIQALSIAPQFLVQDLAASLTYYTSIGFEQAIDYGGFYASVTLGSAEIHLKCAPECDGKRTHQHDNDHIDAMIQVRDVHAAHDILSARGATILRGLEAHPWGSTDFYLTDPDDHIICFAQTA